MPKVLRISKERKVEEVSPGVALGDWDVRAVLLQTLIPLGLEAARALFDVGEGQVDLARELAPRGDEQVRPEPGPARKGP